MPTNIITILKAPFHHAKKDIDDLITLHHFNLGPIDAIPTAAAWTVGNCFIALRGLTDTTSEVGLFVAKRGEGHKAGHRIKPDLDARRIWGDLLERWRKLRWIDKRSIDETTELMRGQDWRELVVDGEEKMRDDPLLRSVPRQTTPDWYRLKKETLQREFPDTWQEKWEEVARYKNLLAEIREYRDEMSKEDAWQDRPPAGAAKEYLDKLRSDTSHTNNEAQPATTIKVAPTEIFTAVMGILEDLCGHFRLGHSFTAEPSPHRIELALWHQSDVIDLARQKEADAYAMMAEMSHRILPSSKTDLILDWSQELFAVRYRLSLDSDVREYLHKQLGANNLGRIIVFAPIPTQSEQGAQNESAMVPAPATDATSFNLPPVEDPTDQRILQWVTEDPDLTDLKIGQRLGITRQSVNTRRKRLEAMGYKVR